jgi:hypothetical protein
MHSNNCEKYQSTIQQTVRKQKKIQQIMKTARSDKRLYLWDQVWWYMPAILDSQEEGGGAWSKEV